MPDLAPAVPGAPQVAAHVGVSVPTTGPMPVALQNSPVEVIKGAASGTLTPRTRSRSREPIFRYDRRRARRQDPGAARTRHRFVRRGKLRTAAISSRRAQWQPDRRSDAQAGKEWPARRATGPAGMNPRREITTY
jgi:hypothetical protein